MKWSWKLGEYADIGVYIHVTFLLLIGWVGYSQWLQENSLAAVVTGVGFILALFGCVVLHEFGHALTAKRYGIVTQDITLLPIGGVARLERMPDVPHHELWVALAGPTVNLVLALGLFTWNQLSTGLSPLSRLDVTTGQFTERLLMVNVFLVGFNMIPAFPMDGGRALRALLALRLEYTRATQVAAGLGQAIALLLGFVGLFTDPFLVFIALFVWIGAGREFNMVQIKSTLGGIPVCRAMITDFDWLFPNDSLARAIELMLLGSQQDFPVVEDERVVGVLTHADLLSAVTQRGQRTPVREVMRQEVQFAQASEMLETAISRLQTCECHALPVLDGGRLVGLLTLQNLGEFLLVQEAQGNAAESRFRT